MLVDMPRFDSLPEHLQGRIADRLAKLEREERVNLDLYHMADTLQTLVLQSAENPAQLAADTAWYFEAHELAQHMAAIHSVSVDVAAGVLAICSPQTSWTQNRQDAHAILVAQTAYPEEDIGDLADRILYASQPDGSGALTTQPGWNILRALRIIRTGDVATWIGYGPKVRSFYNNIRDPEGSEHVTLDTHMARILLDRPELNAQSAEFRALWASRAPQSAADDYTYGLYPWYAEAVRLAARRLQLLPSQVQAAAWCQWRRGPSGSGLTKDRDPQYLTAEQVIRALVRSDWLDAL